MGQAMGILGRGHRKGNGPEVRLRLGDSRKRKEAEMGGEWQAMSRRHTVGVD